MRKVLFIYSIFFILVFGFPIASYSTSINFYDAHGNWGIYDSYYMRMGIGVTVMTDQSDPGFHWIDHTGETIFFDLVLAPNDSGKLFLLNFNPEFVSIVNMLTDDKEDTFSYEFGLVGWGGVQGYFSDLQFQNDLQGQVINSFAIHINELTINSPGSDPNNDGNWTESVFDADFLIDSSPAPVPEPATIILLITGLLGLAGFRKN